MTFRFASLFSGAMGLDLGIESVGGHPTFANEIDRGAVATIKHNRPDLPVFTGSVTDLTGQAYTDMTGIPKGDLDLLCGGPPCQAFSVYGNRSGTLDPRGQMVFEYVRLVGEIQPKTFLMENVRGLHSMPLVPKSHACKVAGYEEWMSEKGSLLASLVRSLRSHGYEVDVFLVNSVNYGAPQIRERLIVMGNRLGLQNSMSDPTHSNRPQDGLPGFRTLQDAIGDGFIDKTPEIMDFSPRKLKYLAMVPPGGNWRSLPVDIQKESMGKAWHLKGGRSATWRRLSWEYPSPTVVTLPNHASTSMCHPEEIRALTVGECAAIQEFPDSWIFQGSTVEKYRQVGNAVPVRLGAIVGSAVARLLAGDAKPSRQERDSTAVNVVHIRPHVRTKRYWMNGEAMTGDSGYYDED